MGYGYAGGRERVTSATNISSNNAECDRQVNRPDTQVGRGARKARKG
jgi:hypothetical protein